MRTTTVREIQHQDARQLTRLLCEDRGLKRDLGKREDFRTTVEEFESYGREWCRTRRATTFAIVSDGIAVGTISLSHRSADGRSAQIGYWIGTQYRRQGHATRAFRAVLGIGAAEGVETVCATIDPDNVPSKRLWERLGASAQSTEDGRQRYTISRIGDVIPESGLQRHETRGECA